MVASATMGPRLLSLSSACLALILGAFGCDRGSPSATSEPRGTPPAAPSAKAPASTPASGPDGGGLDPLVSTKPFVPTENYLPRAMQGWKVHVNRELLGAQKPLGDKALALLDTKLALFRSVVPAHALAALQKVALWLGVDDYAIVNPSYHPSVDWLRAHGWNPAKARGVELGSAQTLLDWSPSQPMMVLHELSHSYHDQVLGYDYKPILVAYEHAQASHKYEAVKRNNGRVERAYALTNAQEYFAEATEAYFGENDFQPFTKAELRTFDPELFAILEDVWHR